MIRRYTFGLTAMVSLGFMLLTGCKEQYMPKTDDINPNYLVIDGLINTGADSTIFKLTRTFKLENKAAVAPERGAIVQVEVEGGPSYTLPELSSKPGFYAIPTLSQDQTKKYRLRVRTKDNKEYLSDFVESRVSPPVELTYDFRHGNLNVYSNTYDPAGKSLYYNYTYVETWEYRAPQLSGLKIENHILKGRNFPADNISMCYHHLASGKVSITSTATSNEDRVTDHLIVDVLPSSPKVKFEYSVLVKQNVLTKAGFEFYETLRNNTEKVGSIFDAQPSVLFGNIKCTSNPTELVIGFISAGTVTEKRIMVLAKDVPFTYVGPLPDSVCLKKNETFSPFSSRFKTFLLDPVKSEYIPVNFDDLGNVIATKFMECVDCTLQGGTNIVPSYWLY